MKAAMPAARALKSTRVVLDEYFPELHSKPRDVRFSFWDTLRHRVLSNAHTGVANYRYYKINNNKQFDAQETGHATWELFRSLNALLLAPATAAVNTRQQLHNELYLTNSLVTEPLAEGIRMKRGERVWDSIPLNRIAGLAKPVQFVQLRHVLIRDSPTSELNFVQATFLVTTNQIPLAPEERQRFLSQFRAVPSDAPGAPRDSRYHGRWLPAASPVGWLYYYNPNTMESKWKPTRYVPSTSYSFATMGTMGVTGRLAAAPSPNSDFLTVENVVVVERPVGFRDDVPLRLHAF